MNYIYNLKYSGDSNLCSKYAVFAKNKAIQVASLLKTNVGIKNFQIADQLNGKLCYVNINVTCNLPFINIVIQTVVPSNNSQLQYSNSGLSKFELNTNNIFYQFYPKDSENSFQDWSNLYKSTQINNLFPFYKTYQGKNVNQSHYIFGRQFTGQMKYEVQKLLGTNNIDINYYNYWSRTNGVYIDSQNNPWIILISTGGLYVRKTKYNIYKDNTTNGSSSGTVQPYPDINILDGTDLNNSDTKLLDMGWFYNDSFSISETQGWAFNKKGNEIQNICIKGVTNFINYRYKITISENISSTNNITLNASFSLVEQKYFKPTRLDSFMSPSYLNSQNYMPEEICTINYSQTKLSPLEKLNLNTSNIIDFTNPNSLDENIYKAPISVFYDDNDNEKILYYYIKKTIKSKSTSSDIGITKYSDYFTNSYISKLGKLTITNDDELDVKFNLMQINAELKHGFMYNNDESTLSIDNLGDLVTEYNVYIPTGSSQIDDFAYQIENGFIPNLTTYHNFNINNILFSDINISQYINQYNAFNQNYKTTINPRYNLTQQIINLNKFLDSFDTNNELYRFNTITELNDLNQFKRLNIKDIENPSLLYQIDNTVMDVFTGINTTTANNFNNKIIDCVNLLSTLNGSTYTNYYQSLENYFSGFYSYLKSFNDTNNLDKIYLNSQINNANISILDINSTIDIINNDINTINNNLSSSDITTILNLINKYNNIVDIYNTKDGNGDAFIDMSDYVRVEISDTISEFYYYSNLLTNLNISKKQTILNKKLTNNVLIFNYSDRNSHTIYTQESNYDEINYYNGKLDNYIKKNSITRTNYYQFYKQTNTMSGSTVVTYGNYELLDSPFYNYKTITRTDRFGNTITINGGDSSLSSYPNYLIYRQDNSTSNYYKDVYLQNWSPIASGTSKYHLTYRNYNYPFLINDYIRNVNKNIKIYDSTIISNPSNMVTDDSRIILNPLENYNWDYLFYYNNYYDYKSNYNDRTIYFNYMRDVYSFNYVVSKDLYSYSQNKQFLTNITKYNIIGNIIPVNFIGNPF